MLATVYIYTHVYIVKVIERSTVIRIIEGEKGYKNNKEKNEWEGAWEVILKSKLEQQACYSPSLKYKFISNNTAESSDGLKQTQMESR